MTYTHYAIAAMQQGKLCRGMYTRSDAAETPDIARHLARPIARHDEYALVRVETADAADKDGSYRRLICETIMDLLPA